MVKCTRRGLVVKRLGVLSKVQMLNLVLGVGVFSLLPKKLSDLGKRRNLRIDRYIYIYVFPILPLRFSPPEDEFGVDMLIT